MSAVAIARAASLLAIACGAPPAPPSLAPAAAPNVDPRCTGAEPRGPIEVSVTVDDPPRHGKLPAGETRLAIHERLRRAFADHAVPGVVGLVNGDRVETADERGALEAWVRAGHPLGNHAFSHRSAESMDPRAFLELVDENEPLLRELAGGGDAFKIFRFPYLHQGKSLEDRAAIRAGLAERRYRVAEVTIDFADWAYTDPYVRCRAAADEASIDAMRASYLEQAEAALAWSDAAACSLLGRPIRHVLLLHAGAFTADRIDALLSAFAAKGVRFVSFDDALADPVYVAEPDSPRTTKGPLLLQIRAARRAEHVPIPVYADPVIGALCPGPPKVAP